MSAKTPHPDCLFCRIARREAPAAVIFEDERMVAFEDIHPQAPVHTLIIPKEHFASLAEVAEKDEALLGGLLLRAHEIAREKGLSARGYRIVLNTGPDSGQAVFHIHVHLLGGRRFDWPPG